MSVEAAFEVGRLYAPIKAIADTLAAAQADVFIELPGLAGYYPMGVRNGVGHAVEHSGTGTNLLQTGTCPTGYDGNAFVQLGNGTNFLGAVTVYGIIGTEAWIDASLRGLTIGGWFMLDTSPTTQTGLVSKDVASPNRGYVLGLTSSNLAFFNVSGDGLTSLSITGTALTVSQWHFVAGRFSPSVELAVFVDSIKSVNTTSIPSSCFVSSQQFEVGRYFAQDARITHAKARDVFICASALSDDLLEQIRDATRP